MFLLMFAIAIVLVVVIFTVQNASPVLVGFFVWSAEVSLAIVIFCSVFAGALLMFCLFVGRELRKKWKSRAKAKAAKAEEAQIIEAVAALPVEEQVKTDTVGESDER